MSKGKTGGNLEPMPFVRKWGATVDGDDHEEGSSTFETEDIKEPSKKHRHRSKSPSKKDKKRSRSPDKKRHKKRSGSREGKSKKRSRSREHGKRNRDERDDQQFSAFPPPADYLQQVQQRQQQIEMQLQLQQQQQEQEQQFKQEYDYGQQSQGMNAQSNQYQQQYQQDWGQQEFAPPSQAHSVPKPGNDALSAALAAATMVAQKLNKSHGTGGPTAPPDLMSKLPQSGNSGIAADSIFSKQQSTNGVKREPGQEQQEMEERRALRKKTRWSDAKAFVPGMPTILPADIDDTQRQIYLLQMDIEETTRRLRSGDFGQNVDPAERSPSPEPVYDATGKRLNTREIRKRQELEQRRHEKIQALLKLNPMYKPPADYRPPNIKLHDKVWIPQEEHPEINFVGLLIGPRGNTLKALEAETGCKIIIRGKGSIKEGKLGSRTGPLPGENEPLHAYVTATDREAIKKGCEKVREIVNAALMIPDGQNELRKLQLRELALLNGTLRPEDVLSGARCANCGSDQHKSWECMEAPNVTANVVCTACGGAGHIAKDCKNPRGALDPAMIDAEYSALMAELGEKPPPGLASMGGIKMTPVHLPTLAAAAAGVTRPRFHLPTPTPIVRVNLAKPIQQQQQPGYPSWAIDGPSAFYGFSGLPGQDPAAAAAAWAAWQGYPTPVPPPPDAGMMNADSGASTSSSGLAMFPPPPPPPPPVPKAELKEEFDSIFYAPPPPL